VARQTFVFSKAHALAKRIPVEQDKKQAAHTVCERLVALLRLRESPSPYLNIRADSLVRDQATLLINTATQLQPQGTPATFPTAGNAQSEVALGCGVAA
jgi:hypothetical protein